MAPLAGGISNDNWLVTDRAGKHVVRFCEDYPFHHVARSRELLVARAAAEAGFAPAVEYSEPGVMVSAYVEAKTLCANDVRVDLPRIAETIRNFHRVMPRYIAGPAFLFWPFHVIRDYARRLAHEQSASTNELPTYLALAEELEAAQVPLPIIFGHNDLLPANLLDDGRRIWLIDFEYAGFSTAMFDLAGLSSNAGFDADESAALLVYYFGAHPDPSLHKSLAAMQCASLLRESLWGMVSELYLRANGVDYALYARENLLRLDQALESYRSHYGQSQ